MSSAPIKSSGGIVAVVKRKSSKSKKVSFSSPSIQQKPKQPQAKEVVKQETTTMASTEDPTDLIRQLDEAFEDLELADKKIEQDAQKIASLEAEINSLRKKSTNLEAKVVEMEKVSAELDDNSFDEAQEFQYKKQIEELQEQLDKRKNLEHQLSETNLELQEVRAQYEAVQFQQQRSHTRSKMKSLSDEASSKEEMQRLQKELRAAERKLEKQQSEFEAKLKVNQDSIQRIQDKNKVIQKRCDDMDKERLQLKLENSRLEKKLEKTGSYAEKKRLKMEQEAAEMELKNMKRKNTKLEKRLSMSTQMLDIMSQGSNLRLDSTPDSPISEMSPSSSGRASPVPAMTLSEARIMNLEKELYQLESKLSSTEEENQKLMDRATTAERNVENLSSRLKEIDSELFHEKEANSSLEMEAETLRQQSVTPISPAGDSDSLQAQIRTLEQEIEDSQVKFRVKEKDLWSTIEAQKRQITELEMDKIALEERLLEEDGTDVEDEDSKDKPSTESGQRVEALEEELCIVKEENTQLKEEIDKLQREAQEIMDSFEAEVGDSTDGGQGTFLMQQNEDLRKTLEEKSEQYVDTIREIARLKNIIEDQENEITIMKATQEYHSQMNAEVMRNGTVTPEVEPPAEETKPKKRRSIKVIATSKEKPKDEAPKKPPPTKKKPKKGKTEE